MRLVEGVADVPDVNAFVDDLADVGDEHDCVIQAFDARLLAGRDHVETALRYAARAHRRDDAIVRNPAVEVLLYAAGRRQIDRALDLGVETGRSPTVVLVASDFPDDPLEPDDSEAAAVDAVAQLLASVDRKDARADDAQADEDRTDDGTFTETDVERVREFFDVGDPEVAATDASLAGLVRERVVLLSIDH